jgi:hypothetical protein
MKYRVQLRNPASGSYWYEELVAENIEHARIVARQRWNYYVEQIKLLPGQTEPEYHTESTHTAVNDPDELNT